MDSNALPPSFFDVLGRLDEPAISSRTILVVVFLALFFPARALLARHVFKSENRWWVANFVALVTLMSAGLLLNLVLPKA